MKVLKKMGMGSHLPTSGALAISFEASKFPQVKEVLSLKLNLTANTSVSVAMVGGAVTVSVET